MGRLFGYVRYCLSLADEVALWNLLMENGIPCRDFTRGERWLSVCVSRRFSARLFAACREAGICLEEASRGGLPAVVSRYRRRWGLMVGAILASLLLFASSRVVWDVRVSGNAALDDETVRQMLAECGLESGARLSRLDTDLIEGRLLLAHREICWVSVNLRGTTAYVELLETARGQRDEAGAVNLVASRDGRIERIEAYDGHVLVKVGDVVRAGELLVSGAYDEGLFGPRVTNARGAVYARTVHTFSVEIPLDYEEKVYTGRVGREIYVNFFSKRIKVFANTGNLGGECDIIYLDNGISLPGGIELPVRTAQTLYREYRMESGRLAGDEAMEKAFAALAQRLAQFVSETGAELLEKSLSFCLDEDSYELSCRVVCIENVAREQEFDVN
ncbi:MAG: sporulation protein YqfD [Clostridia bacterium]|nr:sporulation protein YqfD [Clostridia bacterium]